MQTLLIFLIVIIVLVVAHELGHFFVAKMFGVKVEEFGLGYPPRAKKLFTWKGTLFTLNWLPFGGFVKIFGEDDGTLKKEDSFAYQKLYKRLLILVAGIVANVLLAIVLYSLSFSIGFLGNPSDFSNVHIVSHPNLTVTEVLKNTPASIVGIKENDQITSLSVVGSDTTFSPSGESSFIDFVQTHGKMPIHVGVLRNGEEKFFDITPQTNVVGDKPGIGVGIEEIALLRMPFLQAVSFAFVYTMTEFKMIVVSLCALVGSLFAGNSSIASQLSGPVGIAKFAGAAYTMGIGALFSFMALISVNLAVVNLLPFPALDGGRMFLELFSTNGRNRISPKIVSGINQIGFLILIILMLFVTYHDIFHSI